MWRLAKVVYRSFRNPVTTRCSQDVLFPAGPVSNSNDETEEKLRKKRILNDFQAVKIYKNVFENLSSAYDLIKQFDNRIEKVSLKQFDSSETVFQPDKECLENVQMIAELNKWVQSKIDFEIGIVALDSENFPKAIESFRSSVEKFQNAAALYNLGVCYEEGFGVERDREKAREFYRQASDLGHLQAQICLNSISNDLDERSLVVFS